MKGMLIPTNGNPVEIDIEVDETGSTLHDLQRLVGGNIEPFDVIFGEGISLYVNEEGLFTCPPNRAVYATKGMEEAGYLSMMDYSSPVKEGELYSILCGDLVAVGFDFETGENRDLSADEDVPRSRLLHRGQQTRQRHRGGHRNPHGTAPRGSPLGGWPRHPQGGGSGIACRLRETGRGTRHRLTGTRRPLHRVDI